MQTIVVTGATSGIGKALTKHLVHEGHTVFAFGRAEDKLNHLKDDIGKAKGRLRLMNADFRSLSAVEKALKQLEKALPEGLDVLVNNAAAVPGKKAFTDDGFETQYQVNHLSHVHMTKRLLPLLAKRRGKVITTGSDAHKRARFDYRDIHALKRYHPFRSYCRTKLYNNMMSNYFSRHEDNVTFFVVHPGRVKTDIGTKDTNKFYAFVWRIFTRKGFTPEDTVPTYVMLIDAQTPEQGYYYREALHEESAVAKNTDYQDMLMRHALRELDTLFL